MDIFTMKRDLQPVLTAGTARREPEKAKERPGKRWRCFGAAVRRLRMKEKPWESFRRKSGIDPAVGFLICIEGPDRGADYRLVAGRNFIGRLPSMDVAADGRRYSITGRSRACDL